MTTNQRVNNIIQIFIKNDIPSSQQLEILKMAREKLEWSRKVGSEISKQQVATKIKPI